jgi:hypothetical protein
MPKRPISYTSRDFETIKNSLVNHAKQYYPSTFKDFNEASFGSLMLDMAAYLGDQLSFYADYQANESFLDSAIEYQNVIRLSQQLGFKMPGAASSTGIATFYIMVPASVSTGGPDLDYFPILKRGSSLASSGGGVFTLNEDVDFTDSDNEVTVARVNSTTGVPTWYAIRGFGQVVSGQEAETTLEVGNYQRFLRLELDADNVSEIVKITDAQGNEYYEVEYLSQDVVVSEVPNYESDRDVVPYVIKTKPVPRRFVTEYGADGSVFLQFGYGSAANITGDTIADPADVVLDVVGRNYVTDKSFDPTNLISSDKFGVVPIDTTLTVTYRSNSQETVNVKTGGLNRLIDPQLIFQNEASLSAVTRSTIIQSLEVENSSPITGDTSTLLADEIREMAFSSYTAQNRAVTRSDYVAISYRMPSKFGRVKRVNVVQDTDSVRRNLNLYILSENNEGNFVAANQTLKNNLKKWLNSYRMVNDTVDILDGRVINYGIEFEVSVDMDANKFDILDQCVTKIQEKILNVKKQIGEAVFITEIYKMLNSVPGVNDTLNVELVAKSGGLYSDYYYDIDENLSDDGRYLKIPQDSVAEVLFPNEDILGVVK